MQYCTALNQESFVGRSRKLDTEPLPTHRAEQRALLGFRLERVLDSRNCGAQPSPSAPHRQNTAPTSHPNNEHCSAFVENVSLIP